MTSAKESFLDSKGLQQLLDSTVRSLAINPHRIDAFRFDDGRYKGRGKPVYTTELKRKQLKKEKKERADSKGDKNGQRKAKRAARAAVQGSTADISAYGKFFCNDCKHGWRSGHATFHVLVLNGPDVKYFAPTVMSLYTQKCSRCERDCRPRLEEQSAARAVERASLLAAGQPVDDLRGDWRPTKQPHDSQRCGYCVIFGDSLHCKNNE